MSAARVRLVPSESRDGRDGRAPRDSDTRVFRANQARPGSRVGRVCRAGKDFPSPAPRGSRVQRGPRAPQVPLHGAGRRAVSARRAYKDGKARRVSRAGRASWVPPASRDFRVCSVTRGPRVSPVLPAPAYRVPRDCRAGRAGRAGRDCRAGKAPRARLGQGDSRVSPGVREDRDPPAA